MIEAPKIYKSPLPLSDPRDTVPHAYTVADDKLVIVVTMTVTSLSHSDRPPKLTAPEKFDVTTPPAAVPEIWLVSTKI